MKHVAMFFLLIGAFLMEWSLRGFKSAYHELKLFWTTYNTSVEPEDDRTYE